MNRSSEANIICIKPLPFQCFAISLNCILQSSGIHNQLTKGHPKVCNMINALFLNVFIAFKETHFYIFIKLVAKCRT